MPPCSAHRGTLVTVASTTPHAARGFHLLCVKILIPLAILFLIVGICTAVTNDDSEPVKSTSPSVQPTRPSINPTPTRYSPPPTRRPPSPTRSIPTRTSRPTPTAINEDEHQLWLAWPDHYDDLQGLLEDMDKNSKSIMADGILDASDLASLCPALSGWERRLNPIAQFMSDYRATDPDTIEQNTPLQRMEEALTVARDHLNNSRALCN